MKKSHCYLIENLLLPLFDISKGEKKKFLMEFLMGFWQCQVAIVLGRLAKKR
jgi:hypothetical protein